MKLKSEIKSSDGLVREIEIEIPADMVDKAFSDQYKKYQKEAKIKGFRPGKVPMSVIKSKFYDLIRGEVLQDLVGQTYPQAVKEHNLKVASQPDFADLDIHEGSPLKFIAKLEVMPEIEKVDYERIVLPKEEIEVRDAEVDAVVEYLRKKKADIRKVDRAATKSDTLILDLVKLDDPDKLLNTDKFDDIELDLSSEVTVKEFREVLDGIKAGEEREVQVNYPEDFSNTSLAGKSIKYLCKVKEVKEKVLPEANDAFAKAHGESETMLEMRLKIRGDLKKQKELDHRQWERQEVRRQVIERNKIPIPGAMIEKYLESIMEDMKRRNEPFEEKMVREQYRSVAEDSIRWNLLMDRLAELEKIEVFPSDTENWIKSFAANYKMEAEKAKKMLAQSGKLPEVRDNLLEDKTLNHILAKAEYVRDITDVKITAGSESNESKKDDAKVAETQESENNITEEL
ncbi:MAG: trigger factor [candidate division Zixibacteria bacterium HGW-Zixibacteria-1]|nr:MAG: trigger factor [candidate division Zixibacteria bacterium HGW-Zixibacteria-1]